MKEYYKKIYKGSKAEFMKKLEGEIEAGEKAVRGDCQS